MKKLFIFIVLVSAHNIINAQIVKNNEVNQTKSSKTKTTKTTTIPEKPKQIVIPTPEFINQPFYYDVNENKLIKLESTTAQLVTKKKTLGLKGSKQSLAMSDPSSKVRFIAKDSLNFIIKTSGDAIDMTSYIKLYKFTVNGEKREVNISSKEGMLNDKEEQKGKNVSFSVKLIAPDNYMIQFADQLEAGEYGFVWLKNMDLKECNVFAFGIDWKSAN